MDIKNLDSVAEQIVNMLFENPYMDPDYMFEKQTVFNFDHMYGCDIHGVFKNKPFDHVFRIKEKCSLRKVLETYAEAYGIWCWDNGLEPIITHALCEIVEYEEVSHVSFESASLWVGKP